MTPCSAKSILARPGGSPPDLFSHLILFRDSTMSWPRFVLLASLIVLGVVSQLLPHPPNVTAVGALALFAGAMFRDRRIAFALPLSTLLLSDLTRGLHVLIPVVYGSFAVSVLIGRWLGTSRTFVGVSLAALLGAIQFFAVTNFAIWLLYYPPTWEGFSECYALAIPYFRNSLMGDAVFTAGLFGSVWVAEDVLPAVRVRIPATLTA